jgi:hypothetical protein
MQISLAVLMYENVNGSFPPAYIADKNGKPMHSWRVLILPYIGQASLYKAYNFAEPWDGPTNKKLLSSRSPIFACPADPTANAPGATQTSYLAVVGCNAAWPADTSKKRGLDGLQGASSSTVLIVEVANSGIQWTEPKDLSLDALEAAVGKSRAVIVSSNHRSLDDFFFAQEGCDASAAMADGHIERLPTASLSPERLRDILRIGGFWPYGTNSAEALGASRRLNWPNIASLAVWLLSVGTLLTVAARGTKARRGRSISTSGRT